jgi:lipopolysaccharide/colanic/teichoic acid biosynthesis glycosyltransferase
MSSNEASAGRKSGERADPRAARPWRHGSGSTAPAVRWQLIGKRVVDIVVSSAGLILLSPLLALAMLAIRLTSPGPVFFRWPVVGKGGRALHAYKLRTMVVGADAIKAQLWAQNESTGPVFKMRNDPRVTPVGRILRKYSIDELPQLWNVLKGNMSLVGPRPVLTYEWEQFTGTQRRKLDAKPGMISLWHLRGQPRDFDEWLRLDLEYIDRWSLWLDLQILAGGAAYLVSGKNY